MASLVEYRILPPGGTSEFTPAVLNTPIEHLIDMLLAATMQPPPDHE